MKKSKLIIFGMGSGAIKALNSIDLKKAEIIAFCDSYKKGNFNEKKIINPVDISKYTYDYILITSEYYREIKENLIGIGIDEKKIISYFFYRDDLNFNVYYNEKIYKERIMSDGYIRDIAKDRIITFDLPNVTQEEIVKNSLAEALKKTYNSHYLSSNDRWSEINIDNAELRIKSLLNKIELYGNKVLDVGCAKGYFTEAFRQEKLDAYGIDYSDVAIDIAKKQFQNCNFYVMDAFNPNFKDQIKFDLVFMRGFSGCDTLDFDFVKQFMNKYYEVMNENSYFILAYSSDFSGKKYVNDTVNWSYEQIDNLIQSTKFEKQSIEFIDEEIWPHKLNSLVDYRKRYFYLILKKN